MGCASTQLPCPQPSCSTLTPAALPPSQLPCLLPSCWLPRRAARGGEGPAPPQGAWPARARCRFPRSPRPPPQARSRPSTPALSQTGRRGCAKSKVVMQWTCTMDLGKCRCRAFLRLENNFRAERRRPEKSGEQVQRPDGTRAVPHSAPVAALVS
jgi:hypothetical protein